jgi:hypothetical protein
MELIVRRKLTNRVGQARMVSIPPYFLDAMNALDVMEVKLSMLDKDHIIMEMVRNDEPSQDNLKRFAEWKSLLKIGEDGNE